MWIIEENGNIHVWTNKKDDDFLQFIPDHLGCKPEDLSAYWTDDESIADGLKPNREIKKKGEKFEYGKKEIKRTQMQYDEETGEKLGRKPTVIQKKEKLGSVSVRKLKSWPYKDGRFTGNELED